MGMTTNCIDCGKKVNKVFSPCDVYPEGYVCRECADKRLANKEKLEPNVTESNKVETEKEMLDQVICTKCHSISNVPLKQTWCKLQRFVCPKCKEKVTYPMEPKDRKFAIWLALGMIAWFIIYLPLKGQSITPPDVLISFLCGVALLYRLIGLIIDSYISKKIELARDHCRELRGSLQDEEKLEEILDQELLKRETEKTKHYIEKAKRLREEAKKLPRHSKKERDLIGRAENLEELAKKHSPN